MRLPRLVRRYALPPDATTIEDKDEHLFASAISAARALFLRDIREVPCPYPLTHKREECQGDFERDNLTRILQERILLYARAIGANFDSACRQVEAARRNLFAIEEACHDAWNYRCDWFHLSPRAKQRLYRNLDAYIKAASDLGFLPEEAIGHVWRHAPGCRHALHTP